MRKLEREVIGAFLERRSRKVGNTSTDGHVLYLHGNPIARRILTGFQVSLAGWPTATTRSRINALSRMAGTTTYVYQRDHVTWIADPELPLEQMDPYEWYWLA